MKLRDYLNARSGDTLKRWLSILKISSSGLTRKELMIDALEHRVLHELPEYLSLLSEPEKAYLAECAHTGRVPSGEAFLAKYGRPVYPEVRDRWSPEARAIKRHTDVIVGQLASGDAPLLASELIAPLKTRLPRPVAVPLKSLESIPDQLEVQSRLWGGPRPIHVFESEKVSQQELMRVLRLVQAGRIEVSDSSHRPTSTAIRAVTEILVVPDYLLDEPPPAEVSPSIFRSEPDKPGAVRAHAWPVVVQQCGWAKRRGKLLRLTPAGEALLVRFDPQLLNDGVNRLIFDDTFDELNRVPAIRGQSGNAKRHLTSSSSRRESLYDGFGQLPANTWIPFPELLRYLRATDVEWPVGGDGRLYFGELQYGAIYGHLGLENQYLRVLLMETLATLGLVDIAYTYPAGLYPDFRDRWGMDDLSYISRYDGLHYVRVTPLGAYVFALPDQKPKYTGAIPKAIYTLNSDSEIVPVHAELDASTRAYLEQFAEPKEGGNWRIDERKVLNHLAAGVSTETVLSWVRAGLAADLPEGFADFIEGLNVRREACRGMEDAVIIRWSSADLVRMILDSPEVGKLVQAYGRTGIVAPRKNLTALRKLLLAQGFVLPQE